MSTLMRFVPAMLAHRCCWPSRARGDRAGPTRAGYGLQPMGTRLRCRTIARRAAADRDHRGAIWQGQAGPRTPRLCCGFISAGRTD